MTARAGLTVMLLTAHRLEYAKRTLESAMRNLKSSETNFCVHIASDGDSDEYINELVAIASMRPGVGEAVSVSNAGLTGYGANFNLAMHDIKTDLLLPLEDDWELVRELDIDPICQILRDNVFDCVRMGYIGYTQELRAKFVWCNYRHWLELDPDSAERHVFAGHPRIERVDWIRPWPVGLAPGATEFEVAGNVRARIAWPLDLIKPSENVWGHIGAIRSY